MAIIEPENLSTGPPVPYASRNPRQFSKARRGHSLVILAKAPNRGGQRGVGVSTLEREPESQGLSREQKWAMLRRMMKAYVFHPHATRGAIRAEIERWNAIFMTINAYRVEALRAFVEP